VDDRKGEPLRPIAGGTDSSRRSAATEPLPGATITFRFTAIEGSTRLPARLGERYCALLLDHQRLLRRAFADSRKPFVAGRRACRRANGPAHW
jgi:hypothetical protein